MEEESKWHPHLLFVASENDPPGSQNLVGVMSTDAGQLASLRACPDYRGYRVAWYKAGHAQIEADHHHYRNPTLRIDGKFVIQHYEPPRSSFSEGDWLVGVYADAEPSACAAASDINHWRKYGLSMGSDWIGLLTPIAQD